MTEGDGTSYNSAHRRVVQAHGKASLHICVGVPDEPCGDPAEEWSYIGGDPNEKIFRRAGRKREQKYSLDPNYYAPRCRPCHIKFDLPRQHRGEANGQAKLTAEQVRAIRTAYTGQSGQQRVLARQYGVGQSQISRIVNNEKWREDR